MDVKEIIESGRLELYVCGALSSEEAAEIDQAISESVEIRKEVESIDASLIHKTEKIA